MIFLSLDLCKENVNEFLESLEEIKNSKFDGVEINLWEDINSYSTKIKSKLDEAGLKVNVHTDIMRLEEGLEKVYEKFRYSLEFAKLVGANKVITHPIKPYNETLEESKKLFDQFNNQSFLLETVQGIRLPETKYFNLILALDIGSVTKNGDLDKLSDFENVGWLHLHDFKKGLDHYPIGEGVLDFKEILKKFNGIGCTIELGEVFRKWKDLRNDYRKSIDQLNNTIISLESYGKNVRLKHLHNLIQGKKFSKALEFGCGSGYLLHNITATKKIGYDLRPKKVFNDIDYFTKDISNVNESNSDLVICSEVIEHVLDPLPAIKKMYKSLIEDGFIFLTTINKNTLENKSEKDKLRGHFKRYGEELKQIMETEGFTTLEFYPLRGKHYYDFKGNFSKYDCEKDKEDSLEHASGWVYFGKKFVDGYSK